MPEPSLAIQTEQLVEIVRGLIRLKPRLAPVLPEDLEQLRTRILNLHLDGSKRTTDFALFHRISIILFQQREPVTMGHLSAALSVPMSTATRSMDSLVESGFVERLPDPADRRVVRIALTKTGRELYEAFDQILRSRVKLFLNVFTLEEREQLVMLLQKAVSTLEKMEG